jgi:hypothetical protein
MRPAGRRRSHSSPRTFLFLAALLLPIAARAQNAKADPEAQDTRKYDVALSGFYQVTGASNGNFIREDTSESLGGLLSFRQPYKPLLGYEVNYGLTRFSEFYNKGVVTVQNNVDEFSASYLVHAPSTYYGLQPFATIGFGIMIFAPTQGAQSGFSPQILPAFIYSLGVNRPILSRHIGIRVQYRALKYKTPNYNDVLLDTHQLRTTMEPSAGVYFRF